MQVKLINELSVNELRNELLRCCGSRRWVEGLAARRPFKDSEELFNVSDQLWFALEKSDWLEAFSSHPKIGDVDSLRKKFATTQAWASSEQSGVKGADDSVLEALNEGNQAYESKFGYIFIVCATGKTAEQMLAILQSRLPNDATEEILVAAAEQNKITRIRLEKLCQEVPSQPTC